MNLETFFEKFDLFADCPNAVQKMRELILELAVQGKLVEQEGGWRDDDTKPFPIPGNWKWDTLGEVAIIVRGITFPGSAKSRSPGDGLVACLRTASVQDEIDWDDMIYVPKEFVGREDQWVKTDDVMISMANSYELVGKVAVIRSIPMVATFGGFLASIRPKGIDPFFLLYFLRSPGMQRAFRESSSQTTNIANISLGRMKPLPFPLPPLAEQKRIVAKVDELMALCDALEAQQKEREAKRSALAKASLAAFAEAPSPTSLELLFHSSYAIDPADLRKSILTLAVQGKLVEQDGGDEGADELLARISSERNQLLESGYPNPNESAGQLRKQASQELPELLSTLPSGWQWATLIQLSLLVVDCHNKTAPYSASGIRLLRTTNIRDGRMNFLEPKFVSEEVYGRWSQRCYPDSGDILITREAPMGEVCVIPAGAKICMGQRMMLARFVKGTIDPQYVAYTIMEPGMMDRVQDKPVGATVQHLRVGGIETMLVPLPPPRRAEADRGQGGRADGAGGPTGGKTCRVARGGLAADGGDGRGAGGEGRLKDVLRRSLQHTIPFGAGTQGAADVCPCYTRRRWLSDAVSLPNRDGPMGRCIEAIGAPAPGMRRGAQRAAPRPSARARARSSPVPTATAGTSRRDAKSCLPDCVPNWSPIASRGPVSSGGEAPYPRPTPAQTEQMSSL